MSLERGTRLGPYEVTELRGSGGMGEVYSALDTRLERRVAVKVLPAELSEDATYRRRLEREAKSLARLQHPHVCTLLDVGTAEEAPFFLVMELLTGATLAERLEAGPLELDEALRFGLQIAEALDAAHRLDLVHRDLKPGNVMITDHGVKVLDFGLAKGVSPPTTEEEVDADAPTRTRAITRPGAVAGTVPYMAPEQLEGKPADPRSDLWALGCVLYEMVTGRAPFRGESDASLITAIMSNEPEVASAIRGLSPPSLDRLITRCLKKNPERRAQTAREVALALEEIAQTLDNDLPSEPWTSGADQSSKGLTSSRLGAVALATAAVAVAALAWWLLGVARDHRLANLIAELQGPSLEAVLVFDLLSDDPELERLASEITAELLAGDGLSKVRVNPESVDRLDICGSLEGVRWVVAGSLRRVGETVRVESTLTSCPEGIVRRRIPSEHDPSAAGLADLVVTRFRVETNTLKNRDRGVEGSVRWYLSQRTAEANTRALSLMEKALRYDSDSFFLWTAYNWLHLQRLMEGWATSPNESVAAQERAAQQLLELDPLDLEGHLVLGFSGLFGGDREAMLRGFERAVGLLERPFTLAWIGRGQLLAGQIDEALASVQKAKDMTSTEDLGYKVLLATEALARFAARDYEAARDATLNGLDDNDNDLYNIRADLYQILAASSAHLGLSTQATDALEHARRLRPALSPKVALIPFAAADSELQNSYLRGLLQAGLEGDATTTFGHLEGDPIELLRVRSSGTAVALFENRSGDPELDELAIAIQEEMRAAAVRRGDSMKAIESSPTDPTELCAESPDTRWIYGGTLRSLQQSVGIRAEMIGCPEALSRWDHDWDRSSDDLVSVAEEIANLILTGSQQTKVYDPGPTGSARWYLQQVDEDYNTRLLSLVEDIASRYPEERSSWFATRYEAYLQRLFEGWADPPEPILQALDGLAQEGLDSSSQNFLVQLVAGSAASFRGDHERAASHFKSAVLRSTSSAGFEYPVTSAVLGGELAVAAKTEEALAALERAKRGSFPSDPLQTLVAYHEAIALFAAERYPEAAQAARRGADRNERTYWNTQAGSLEALSASLVMIGREEEAEQNLARAKELRPALSARVVSLRLSSANHEFRSRYLAALRRAGLSG